MDILWVLDVFMQFMFAVLTFLSPETVLDFATRNPTFREIETYYLNIKRKLARMFFKL